MLMATERSIFSPGSKRSKYGAVSTSVDGIWFASKLEAQRYSELKLMEKAGAITPQNLDQLLWRFIGLWPELAV